MDSKARREGACLSRWGQLPASGRSRWPHLTRPFSPCAHGRQFVAESGTLNPTVPNLTRSRRAHTAPGRDSAEQARLGALTWSRVRHADARIGGQNGSRTRRDSAVPLRVAVPAQSWPVRESADPLRGSKGLVVTSSPPAPRHRGRLSLGHFRTAHLPPRH